MGIPKMMGFDQWMKHYALHGRESKCDHCEGGTTQGHPCHWCDGTGVTNSLRDRYEEEKKEWQERLVLWEEKK